MMSQTSLPTPPLLSVRTLSKTFVLHTQDGVHLPVFNDLSVDVHGGECIALHGPSGTGKSTLLRALYANYKADQGHIIVQHQGQAIDMVTAPPRDILAVRRQTMGYVSQFLRVIPRVSSLDIVADPLRALGVEAPKARLRAAELLERLNIPQRLWSLAPATFSGGEQQRVNIARGFAHPYPVLLLDEPTASLDATNRAVVMELITEAKTAGAAVVGIFHDADVRNSVCDRLFPLDSYKKAA
jgi:alpha-D-ribose 1-methylphosphonate 5-triphosphate synthase subunit PhnL